MSDPEKYVSKVGGSKWKEPRKLGDCWCTVSDFIFVQHNCPDARNYYRRTGWRPEIKTGLNQFNGVKATID